MKKIIARVLNSFGYSIIHTNSVPADFDDDIKVIINRVQPYTMTSAERLNALCLATKYIVTNNIEGDIVECGVWRGGSMLAVSHMLHALNDISRTLWMYDTFEGMSSPTENDYDFSGTSARILLSKEDNSPNSIIWCCASLNDVKDNMKLSQYPNGKIKFIQGKVEETLKRALPETIALLRLDTDWYESTKAEMEHLFPRLAKGGVLIIDDYGHWQGARRAVDEYISNKQVRILLNRIDYTGRIAVKVE